MKAKHQLSKFICEDCRKAMAPAIALYTLKELFGGLLTIYTANILGKFADMVFVGEIFFGMQYFWQLLLCVCCMVAVLPLIETLAEVFIFSESLDYCLMVFGRYLDKSYPSVCRMERGEAQYRLEDDVIEFYLSYTNLHVKLFVIPFIFGYLIYHAGKISVLFTAVVFAVSLVKLFVPMIVRKRRAVYAQEDSNYRMQVRSKETEMTAMPYMINMLGIKNAWFEKMNQLFRKYYAKTGRKSIRCEVITGNISNFLNTFCILLILWIGAVMTAKGFIYPGAVAAMAGYFSVFYTVDEYMTFCIQNIPVFKNLLKRMEVIYEGKEEISSIEAGKVEEIVSTNLSFSYDSNSIDKVFEGIDFHIQKNSKTVICGANGSGKSTLLKLLCGLQSDYDGSIWLNGKELNQINIESWRRQVAYAAQEPFLFKGSVKDNIRLGNLEADEYKAEQVMEELGISYLADREVSAKHNELSGGERQKVSIARAMMKDAPFLILDEPGNYLDEETRGWLNDFIRKVPRTVIFISHDDMLMQEADYRIEM